MHNDLVDRDFTAAEANVTWLTDITEHPTSEGKLYLCAIKDVWSTRIVGYSISDRMTASPAMRRSPHVGFSPAMRITSARISGAVDGLPGG